MLAGNMKKIRKYFDPIDRYIAGVMQKVGYLMLRYSLGVVYLWFGGLKLLGHSPEEEIIREVVYFIPADVMIPLLGYWEVLIGVCMLHRPWVRAAILLLLLQMPGTALPLVLIPEVCYAGTILNLTLEGQYIIKNLLIISAALVVGGKVREASCGERIL